MGVVRPVAEKAGLKFHTLCNGLYKQNCYVVESLSSGEAVLVDPGSEPEFIVEQVRALNLKIVKIILTHGHFDHLGAVDFLMKEFGVACEAHAAEKKLVRQASTYAFRFARQKLLPPMNLSYYESLDAATWSGGTIRILHTPGHTSGSVSYIFNDAAVFTGDTLFHSHIGPTNYPESDPEGILKSVTAILENLPGDCLIFPGHSKPWTVEEARAWWQREAAKPPSFQLFGDNPK